MEPVVGFTTFIIVLCVTFAVLYVGIAMQYVVVTVCNNEIHRCMKYITCRTVLSIYVYSVYATLVWFSGSFASVLHCIVVAMHCCAVGCVCTSIRSVEFGFVSHSVQE